MKIFKISILSVFILCFSFVKAQRPFFFDSFEDPNALDYYTIIDANGDANGNLNTWKTGGPFSNTPISGGYGHSSFRTAYIESENASDDWMITPRLKVFQNYNFSFWAQSENSTSLESIDVMISTDPDSTNLSAYKKVATITNIPAGLSFFDKAAFGQTAYYWGTGGEWTNYSYKLESISGIAAGDRVFVAFHSTRASGGGLLLDEISYNYYCYPLYNSGSTIVSEEKLIGGYMTSYARFHIATVAFNQIYGPGQGGTTSDPGGDTYADDYFYIRSDLKYNFPDLNTGGSVDTIGRATIIPGMMHQMGIRTYHWIDDQMFTQTLDYNVAAWIDYNGDGIFADNERVANSYIAPSNAMGNKIVYSYFTVPTTAVVGNTTCRVRILYNDAGSASLQAKACDNYEYGQTFDYDVQIIPNIGPKPKLFTKGEQPDAITNTKLYLSHVDIQNLISNSAYLGSQDLISGVITSYNYVNYMWKGPAYVKTGKKDTVNITVTRGTGITRATVGAWIDFNNDGVFDETPTSPTGGERLGLTTSVTAWSNNEADVQFIFDVPSTAVAGKEVVMRVKTVNGNVATMTSISNPVNPSETEDYRVHFISSTCTAPSITASPLGGAKCENGSITFNITATGTDPLTYKWYKDGSLISNESTTSYTISKIVPTDAGSYTCVVSNGCGSPTCNAAVLTVNNLADFTTEPTSLSQCPGTTAIFTASSTSFPVSYQWYKDGSLFSGKTSNSLSLPGIKAVDAGSYTCVIKNACGENTSTAATLTLKAAPTITTQPSGASKCDKDNITFSVTADGSATLSYQWNKNKAIITDASGSAYTLSNITSTDAGDYTCVITNECGAITSSTATLSVGTAPVITHISPNKLKCQRDTALFRVVAQGSDLKYQWYYNGSIFTGATKSDYTISPILSFDAGTYFCVVSNSCKSSTSANSVLTVGLSPQITKTIKDTALCQGSNITFTITATNALSYQWTRITNGDIAGATKTTYTINDLQVSDEDYYSCKVGNNCEIKTLKAFRLSVKQKPSITTNPTTQTKNLGESLSYSLSPSGGSPFTYQWLKDNKNIDGAINDGFNITSIVATDAGHYSCIITNACGSTTADVGTLIIPGVNGSVYGILNYDNSALTPMSNTTVYLQTVNGTLYGTSVTDNAGSFIFNDVNPGEYKFDGLCTKEWGGADPVDALTTNKIYMGRVTYTDKLKNEAADVNNDGGITPVDALLINKRFSGSITKFSAGDWAFNHDTTTVDGTVQHNLLTLCYGDVNGSYTPAKKLIADINLITNYELRITNNDVIEIPVRVTRDIEIGALGLVLNFNKDNYSVINVRSNIDGLIYHIDNGNVAIAWAALNNNLNSNPDEPVCYITIKLNISHLSTVSSIFTIDPRSVIADGNANIYHGEKISIPSLKIAGTETNDYYLGNNYPNPFNNSTIIEYKIPQTAHVSLKVYNVLGVLVGELVNSNQESGIYKASFDGSNLAPGAYMYKLEAKAANGNYSLTKLMIVH